MNKVKVILDSGAYTAHKKGINISIDEYAEYVKNHNNEYNGGAFNLDVIGDAKASYENWKYLINKGVNVIPVYHIGTPEKYLKYYLKETDYIGLGAIADLSTSKRIPSLDRIWNEYFLTSKGITKVKVHGLGITAFDLMKRYPWYSVDSMTPVMAAAFGGLFLPKYTNGVFRYDLIFSCKISDQAKYTIGTTTHFPNLPVFLQEKYIELFEQNGFKLGDLYYKRKKLKEGEKVKPTLFPNMVKEVISGTEKTLANDWEERMVWNLFVWNEIKKQHLNKMILYLGCSTARHARIFSKFEPRHDVLVSYAYINDTYYKDIMKYKNRTK